MLSILRFSSSNGHSSGSLGEALLNLSFLRAGVSRTGSVDQLNDHLRRDVGLAPREKASTVLRDFRW